MSPLAFDLERRFPRGPTVRAALELPPGGGGVTVLFGPSGAGKTTVLRCVAGLERPDGGYVRFGEETWAHVAARRFTAPQRRRVGLLFQEYALFPHLDVARNIGYGLRGLPRGLRGARVDEVARLVGVSGLLARRPDRLSGGERQRVALARALAPRPRLLLLDEPLSALDAPTREELRGELRRLLVLGSIPALVVTHDRADALVLGDSLAVLAEGRVRQVGGVREVFGLPADSVVARAVGIENVLPALPLERGGGRVQLAVGHARLSAIDPGALPGDAYACIRAEDVLLEPATRTTPGASNVLDCTVRTVRDDGPLVRVTLDCGFPLVAVVTRAEAGRAAPEPGKLLRARLDVSSIRLVPGCGSVAEALSTG